MFTAELDRLREENRRLHEELAALRPAPPPPPIPAAVRLATPPQPKPKPRVSLEEARAMAAEWAAMRRVPDRAEDPDA